MTEIVSSPRRAPGERVARRRGDVHDLDLEPVGVEARRAPGGPCAAARRRGARVSSSQNIAGRPVARARSTASATQSRIGASGVRHMPPDVALLDLVLDQRLPGRLVDHAHARRSRDLEGGVVRPVLLGSLRHQADVRGRPHRRRVEGAVLTAVVDGLRVERRVGVVGDHEVGVLLLAARVPHPPGGADRGGHRRVDDHVARDVQVRDAAVGVDHRERRPGGVGGLDRRLDRDALVLGKLLDRAQQGRDAVVGVDADGREARRRASRTARRSRRGRRDRR